MSEMYATWGEQLAINKNFTAIKCGNIKNTANQSSEKLKLGLDCVKHCNYM